MNDIISLVVNVDTRKGFLQDSTVEEPMLNGTRSVDFITEGILNKIKFLEGFNYEVILYIDVHEPLPEYAEKFLFDLLQRENCVIVFSKHREYYKEQVYCPKMNDLNYLQALFLARGKYIIHTDADMAIFRRDSSVLSEWKNWLDTGMYEYISYPSRCSPSAVSDPRFNYRWVSTRFFFCKKDVIDFTEVEKCLHDSNYLYTKYGDSDTPKSPWLEHVLGLISYGPNFSTPNKVFYPSMDYEQCLIFSFSNYNKGTLAKFNNMSYEQVKNFVINNGGIQYPCNVRV
jgi:hypothetical protein